PLFGNIHVHVLLQDLAQVDVAGHERVVHLLHGLLEHRVITQNTRRCRTTRDDHVVTVAVDPGRLGERVTDQLRHEIVQDLLVATDGPVLERNLRGALEETFPVHAGDAVGSGGTQQRTEPFRKVRADRVQITFHHLEVTVVQDEVEGTVVVGLAQGRVHTTGPDRGDRTLRVLPDRVDGLVRAVGHPGHAFTVHVELEQVAAHLQVLTVHAQGSRHSTFQVDRFGTHVRLKVPSELLDLQSSAVIHPGRGKTSTRETVHVGGEGLGVLQGAVLVDLILQVRQRSTGVGDEHKTGDDLVVHLLVGGQGVELLLGQPLVLHRERHRTGDPGVLGGVGVVGRPEGPT